MTSVVYKYIMGGPKEHRQCGQPHRDGHGTCKTVWGPYTSTSTISRHLKEQHGILCSAPAAAAPASSASSVLSAASTDSLKRKDSNSSILSSPPAAKKANKSSAMESFFGPSTLLDFHSQVALTFAECGLPLQLTDNPSFRRLLASYRSCSSSSIPNRNKLRAIQTGLADDKRAELLTLLTESTAPVSLAVDGWTNVRQDKVTNLVLMHNGVAYYWCSITNVIERGTAEWNHRVIKERVDDLIERKVRVVAFVADNESTMNATFDRLQHNFPFLIRVPCAAHTIQLIVHKLLQQAAFRPTIDTITELMQLFKSDKSKRTLLKARQMSEGRALAIIKPNDTRWSSMLAAANRLLQLKPFINGISAKPDAFWSSLSSMSRCLEHFRSATDIIQRDCATLFDVYQQFNALVRSCSVIADEFSNTAARAVRNAIKKRWETHVNAKAALATAVLSFADLAAFPMEQLVEAERFIIHFGSEYLAFYNAAEDVDTAASELTLQLAEFKGRSDRFADLSVNIARVREESYRRCTKEGKALSWQPKTVWHLYSSAYAALSAVALALLSVSASEAAVERTFSAQGDIHSDKRNRLLDSSVESELFVRWNTRALAKKFEPGQFREMDDDYEPSEDESEDAPIFRDSDSEMDQDEDDFDAPFAPAAAAAAAAPPRRTVVDREALHISFVKAYLEQHRDIHPRTAFNGDRINALLAAMETHDPRIDETQENIIKLLRAHAPLRR